jgi:hypothetical protein
MSAWIPAVVIGVEQWYSSGTLWTAMSVGVTLLIGVATLLVTWVPRQRLYYRAPPPTPLLSPGMRDIADLEIRHEGRRLADPHLVEVMLTARGRRDIPSSAFDQGRPLAFDLDARIIEVLQVRCSPTTSLAPPVAHEGSTLRIGPELVGRRQTTIIAVLVDGDRPSLTCTQPILAQVTLVPRDPKDGFPWAAFVVAVVAMATGVTLMWVSTAMLSAALAEKATVPSSSVDLVSLMSLVSFAIGMVAWVVILVRELKQCPRRVHRQVADLPRTTRPRRPRPVRAPFQ